jgi:hypothetical protein
VAWSPGGGQVAFTAAHETEAGKPASSDIYLYIPSSGSIRRLTQLALPQGPVHPYNLQWSPDGSRLYFTAAVSFSASGAGTQIASGWVVSMDGRTMQVFDGSNSSGENLVAWLPGANLLLTSNDPACGESSLRSVNLVSGQIATLWPGCFSDLVYDRARSEVLVSVTAVDASADEAAAEGLYLVPLNQTGPRQLTTKGFEKIYRGDSRTPWYGYNTGQELISITRAGEMTAAFPGATPVEQNGVLLQPLARLPRTESWLWTGEPSGLYLSVKGEMPRLVLDMKVQGWTSSPSISGLYFFYSPSENGLRLYGVRSSDWQPFPVEERLRQPGSLRWAP